MSYRRFRSVFALAALLLAAFASVALAAEGDAPAPNFGALSLLPPFAAIALCLITREVIPSLFVGSWIAGTMVCGWNPILGFGKAIEQIWNSLGDPWGARIVMTCIVMSGMVGIMQAGGGVRAAIRALSRKVKSSRSSQFFTALAGVIIFFEDYVTAAVVGTTMRPISDSYRVSKEKLSYLVDSTAAPVAAIAGVSSWVAYMVGQIGKQFAELGITSSYYNTYLQSVPFVFYNLLALLLVALVVATGRDFGPMLNAELRARTKGKVLRDGAMPLTSGAGDPDLEADENAPDRVCNFILPVLFLVGSIVTMLLVTGGYPKVSLSEAMANSDSSRSLIFGSYASVVLTLALFAVQKGTPMPRLLRGFLKGGQAVFIGSMILIYAWGISASIKSVGTAAYIVSITKDFLTPAWIPLLTFLTGMVVSFCTGTSYGTMGILMPLVVPLLAKVSAQAGIDMMTYMLPTVGAVFAGAVFGDHCSPISDTTIMSSMFCGADHVDHVRTQMPYALLAGLGAGAAYSCIAFGTGLAAALAAGAAVVVVVFFAVSKKVPDYRPEEQ